MKKIAALILSVALPGAMGLGLTSCKDDDPPAKPKLSFAESAIEVNEDDGVVEVELRLDKAHSKDLRIEYDLSGTAADQDKVGTANADYEVVGDHGVVEIESGETTGIIKLKIYADATFEEDETIKISITDLNTDEIERTGDDEVVVTIKNDDDKLTASFANATMTINEADGIEVDNDQLFIIPLNIPVQLDKPAPTDVVVKYSIKIDLQDQNRNDAIDSTWAVQNDVPVFYADYSIRGTKGEVRIPSGATSGNIQIYLRSDFAFDPDEEIEITLEPSSSVQVGTNKTMVATINEQDGKLVVLVWDAAYTDVDLDMFLWTGADTTNLDLIIGLSTNPSVTFKAEFLHIPKIFAEGAFGLSYVYWGGTAEPMNFQVRFVDFVDNQDEPEVDWDVFNGSYTKANLNPWTEDNGVYPPLISHRLVITDGTFAYGKIQRPTANSRLRPQAVQPPAQKFQARPHGDFKSVIRNYRK